MTLSGFGSPTVQAEAILAAALIAVFAVLTVGLVTTCERAKGSCDQVLGLANRIPGL